MRRAATAASAGLTSATPRVYSRPFDKREPSGRCSVRARCPRSCYLRQRWHLAPSPELRPSAAS
ncbi:hypothetical protein PR003_g32783 [Phytophthora rubi]|uniref:Uncharacterized protein n=1 Tax=Phytophthora rubi TaxID=129364 RepID=A0A6A4AVG2_9STRA|nr:hypothetical protein PR001_g31744 [Phytophthora rubi]KAE8964909.1 hypothetical protein PR002_g28838 [Phytophthora rubi]KAE9264496.1 hypothetical protein PR003_g32783 [Phytophthora rubi]